MSEGRAIKALLAHPGTQYSAQLARQLARLGLLYRFWTGFGLTEGSWADRTLSRGLPRLHRKLHNRIITDVPATRLRAIPYLELGYLLRMRAGIESQRAVHWRNSRFQRAIPECEIEKSDVGIGFDTSSEILIDRFHALGKPFVVDQTIAHPKAKEATYDVIRRQYPEWAKDLEKRAPDVSAAEEREHSAAERIVVASSFTKSTLLANGVATEKISVNPYGVDLRRFRAVASRSSRPFRFLFAGLISARKGVPLLLDAWRDLDAGDAELLIAGPVSSTAPSEWLQAAHRVKYMGKLSNIALAELMTDCDAFVFPSYFEGFALVLLEAMASGLPVITTHATAGPDLVTEGKDGWVIKAGDLDALLQKMRDCLNNRERLREMRAHARATAERFSWDAFGNRWADILEAVTSTA